MFIIPYHCPLTNHESRTGKRAPWMNGLFIGLLSLLIVLGDLYLVFFDRDSGISLAAHLFGFMFGVTTGMMSRQWGAAPGIGPNGRLEALFDKAGETPHSLVFWLKAMGPAGRRRSRVFTNPLENIMEVQGWILL